MNKVPRAWYDVALHSQQSSEYGHCALVVFDGVAATVLLQLTTPATTN
jgi:hypothetical protein